MDQMKSELYDTANAVKDAITTCKDVIIDNLMDKEQEVHKHIYSTQSIICCDMLSNIMAKKSNCYNNMLRLSTAPSKPKLFC